MNKQNKSAPTKLAFLFLGLASFGLAGEASTQSAGWLGTSQGSYQGNLQGSNSNNLAFGNSQNQIPNIHSAIPQVVQQSTVTQTQTYTNSQPIKSSNTVPTISTLPSSLPYSTGSSSNSFQVTLNGSPYALQNGQSIVIYISGQITTGTVNNGVIYSNNQECNGTALVNGYIRQVTNGRFVDVQQTSNEHSYTLDEFKSYCDQQRNSQTGTNNIYQGNNQGQGYQGAPQNGSQGYQGNHSNNQGGYQPGSQTGNQGGYQTGYQGGNQGSSQSGHQGSSQNGNQGSPNGNQGGYQPGSQSGNQGSQSGNQGGYQEGHNNGYSGSTGSVGGYGTKK